MMRYFRNDITVLFIIWIRLRREDGKVRHTLRHPEELHSTIPEGMIEG